MTTIANLVSDLNRCSLDLYCMLAIYFYFLFPVSNIYIKKNVHEIQFTKFMYF